MLLKMTLIPNIYLYNTNTNKYLPQRPCLSPILFFSSSKLFSTSNDVYRGKALITPPWLPYYLPPHFSQQMSISLSSIKIKNTEPNSPCTAGHGTDHFLKIYKLYKYEYVESDCLIELTEYFVDNGIRKDNP